MKYKVIVDELAYRASASINAEKKGTLKKGQIVTVSKIIEKEEVQKSSKEKVKIPWGRFTMNGKTYYVSTKRKYMQRQYKVIDHAKAVADQTLPAANKVIKNKSQHQSGAYQFTGPKVNCSVYTSYCYYKAGLLGKGVTVSHTKTGARNLKEIKNAKVYHPHCTYKNLPPECKVKGAMCIQESNQFIIGYDGCYTCHSSGKRYTGLSMIRHGKGSYEQTKLIHTVVVPQKEVVYL